MNDCIKRSCLLVIACSTGTLLSHASFAADASTPGTATATIDWSKLQISVTGIDGTIPTVDFSDAEHFVKLVRTITRSIRVELQIPRQLDRHCSKQFRCRNRVRQWTRFPDRLFRNCKLDARRLLKLFRESNREFFFQRPRHPDDNSSLYD